LIPDRSHYENFPVGSWLLPARQRPVIAALYAYARYADDLADEGTAPAFDRAAALEKMALAVKDASHHHPVVELLAPWRSELDTAELLALLEAFRFDALVGKIDDEAHLEWYCARSAAPVGRLMLQLFGRLDPSLRTLSDHVCIALQQINFLQDLPLDLARGRLYMPVAALQAAGLTERSLAQACRDRRLDSEHRAFIALRAKLAFSRLEAGATLPGLIGGRLGLELRAIVAGGRAVLQKLAKAGFDPTQDRCRLSAGDAGLLARCFLWRPKPLPMSVQTKR
jgi:squalene synthase HpnC